jgi:hypothetical protein
MSVHFPVPSAVQRALRSGLLVRPETCERCGRVPKRMRNGTTGIVGHHHDYSRPLDVVWLCRTCHALHHVRRGPRGWRMRQPRGEDR